MQFRVKYKIEVRGESYGGIASEANWFLIDQQGKLYTYDPAGHVQPIGTEYRVAIPLIKINDKWLTVKEIEKHLTEANK